MELESLFADVETRVGPATLSSLGPDARPATWIDQPCHPSDTGSPVGAPSGYLVLDEAQRPAPPGLWPDGIATENEWWSFAEHEARWTDAIAVYLPHHYYGEDWWGIEVDAEALAVQTVAIARLADIGPELIAWHVLRQVLAHAYVHFAFEVCATMIEDVLGEPCCVPYIACRFGRPNRWSGGPLEEAVATHAEVRYAERLLDSGPDPVLERYVEAVRARHRQGPPGYRDFAQLDEAGRRDRIVADVAGLIADRDVWSARWWTAMTDDDRQQVPLSWRGTSALDEFFGVLGRKGSW